MDELKIVLGTSLAEDAFLVKNSEAVISSHQNISMVFGRGTRYTDNFLSVMGTY